MSLRETTALMIRTQSTAGSTAVPGGRAEGRPGNVSQVLGRREGRASAAPSHWPFSVEAFGDPALSRVVISLGPGGRSPYRIEKEGRIPKESENLIMPDSRLLW